MTEINMNKGAREALVEANRQIAMCSTLSVDDNWGAFVYDHLQPIIDQALASLDEGEVEGR